MAREKAEIIEELKELGATQSEATLKKKGVEALEKMVADLKEVEEEASVVKEAPKVEAKEVQGKELTVSQHQLGIFTEFIYHVRNKGAKVKVENLGGGDAYVADGNVEVGATEQRLVAGEFKVIEGSSVVNLLAASQPEIKITELA